MEKIKTIRPRGTDSAKVIEVSEDKIIYGLHVKKKEVKHVSSNQNE